MRLALGSLALHMAYDSYVAHCLYEQMWLDSSYETTVCAYFCSSEIQSLWFRVTIHCAKKQKIKKTFSQMKKDADERAREEEQLK